MKNIHVMKANIKIKSVYTCSLCGLQRVGDTFTFEFSGNSTEDLKRQIDELPQKSNEMPIGWSYNGEFNCGCKHYQNTEN